MICVSQIFVSLVKHCTIPYITKNIVSAINPNRGPKLGALMFVDILTVVYNVTEMQNFKLIHRTFHIKAGMH